MSIVCIDTNILGWGILGMRDGCRQSDIERAEALFFDLDKKRAKIAIPAIVLSELLAGVELGSQEKVAAVCHRRFRVMPFDAAAAKIAAELWLEQAKQNPSLHDSRRGTANWRTLLKADNQIAATAIACKADLIFTNDQEFSKIVCGKIKVCPLPSPPPQQASLFSA